MNSTHNVLSYFRVCWTLKRLLSFRTPGVLIKNIWPAGETLCWFGWLKKVDVCNRDECADAPTAFHSSFYLFHPTCLYVVQVERKPLSHSVTFSSPPRVSPSDGHDLSLSPLSSQSDSDIIITTTAAVCCLASSENNYSHREAVILHTLNMWPGRLIPP